MEAESLFHIYCKEDSDIFEHLPTLYTTVLETKAKNVIELGVRSGRSTAALLAGVDVTEGQVWSCDVHEPSVDGSLAVHPRWTVCIGNDLEVADKAPETCDVLFIDTSHDYAQTKAELETYGPKVRSGGVILLHDTELEHPDMDRSGKPFPVREAILEWLALKPNYEFENHPNCYGLGVIRKP